VVAPPPPLLLPSRHGRIASTQPTPPHGTTATTPMLPSHRQPPALSRSPPMCEPHPRTHPPRSLSALAHAPTHAVHPSRLSPHHRTPMPQRNGNPRRVQRGADTNDDGGGGHVEGRVGTCARADKLRGGKAAGGWSHHGRRSTWKAGAAGACSASAEPRLIPGAATSSYKSTTKACRIIQANDRYMYSPRLGTRPQAKRLLDAGGYQPADDGERGASLKSG
jgi:hypothetical protein